MKKEDLKTGMIVETREGEKYIVFKDISNDESRDVIASNQGGFLYIAGYNNDLTNASGHCFDIVKTYNACSPNIVRALERGDLLTLIWERKEPPQLTERERAYLKAYSYDYEWVARDESGELVVYKLKPSKFQKTLSRMNKNQKFLFIDNDLLDFIKWEDKEPYNIKELLGED